MAPGTEKIVEYLLFTPSLHVAGTGSVEPSYIPLFNSAHLTSAQPKHKNILLDVKVELCADIIRG